MSIVRYLDLVLVALALPVFLAAGLPLEGWGLGAGVWLLQRGVQLQLERRAKASSDPRTVVGLLAGSMIGRGWLVALAVLLVGLGDRHAGLAAAVLVIVLFTVYFTTKMVLRPFEADSPVEAAKAQDAASGGVAHAGVVPGGVATRGSVATATRGSVATARRRSVAGGGSGR